MMIPLLSVIIPSRNEEWLSATCDDIIKNARGETEVIAILDGAWPKTPIKDNPRVKLIYHPESIGQRAATNEGARISMAKYIMKLDAHCALDEGFDLKLTDGCQHDWTVVPRMYNLHTFDWCCEKCGDRRYMGPYPKDCPKCDNKTDFKKIIVWKPRLNRRSDFMRFDSDLHFQYWKDYEKRPESKGDIVDQMCCIGACWMMERSRYWEIEGLDERHGSWGQMGVEIACKSALSGGRQVVNRKTFFSHMFRTQDGFGFPYPNPGTKARVYSRDLWMNNKWSKAIHPLSWLIEKYWPVPGWTDLDLENLKGERNAK